MERECVGVEAAQGGAVFGLDDAEDVCAEGLDDGCGALAVDFSEICAAQLDLAAPIAGAICDHSARAAAAGEQFADVFTDHNVATEGAAEVQDVCFVGVRVGGLI